MLKRAVSPKLCAWAQLWLCCRWWWAEAGNSPSSASTPCPPHKLAHIGGKQPEGWPGVLDSQSNVWSTTQLSPTYGGVSECSLQGLRALGGREGVNLGRSLVEVCPLWGLGCFFPGLGGVSPSFQEGKPFIFPPLCWEHYTRVGGNDNVELNEN